MPGSAYRQQIILAIAAIGKARRDLAIVAEAAQHVVGQLSDVERKLIDDVNEEIEKEEAADDRTRRSEGASARDPWRGENR